MIEIIGVLFLLYLVYFSIIVDGYGPSPLPFFGNLLLIIDDHKNRNQQNRNQQKIDNRIQQYGRAYRLYIPNHWFQLKRWVCVYDEQDIKHILKTNFDNYIKGREQQEIFNELLGDGIFNSDGDTWKEHRKISSHNFSQLNIRTFMSNVFIEHANEFNKSLDIYIDKHREIVDLQALFKRLIFDIICKIALGINSNSVEIYNCLTIDNYKMVKYTDIETIRKNIRFNKSFDNVQTIIENRFMSPFWKLKNKLKIGIEEKYSENINEIDTFIYNIIGELKDNRAKNDDQTKNEEKTSPEDIKTSIIDHFISSGITSDKQLRDIVTNFLLAGRDTSASALTFCSFRTKTRH